MTEQAAAIRPLNLPQSSPAAARSRILSITNAQLLIALVLTIITAPMVEQLPSGDFVETIVLTLLLLSGVLSVASRRRTMVVVASFATAAVAFRWIDRCHPGDLPHGLATGMIMLTLGLVMLQLLHFVLQASRVDSEVLCAAVSVYLLMGLFWAFAYKLSAQLLPVAFVMGTPDAPPCRMLGFDPFYFSFATLTTLGYGDIVPAANVTRMLAVTESISGLFYMTVLIARLVSIQTATIPRSRRRSA